ncbi:MAG TPA: crosslink repair DNA glycosylase YcaQ family protein [Trebonia sp.]|jgi:hypothetical protein|nr:crosslink repair DNA glycosylase YcaQ family protein [Trebonia sp.]
MSSAVELTPDEVRRITLHAQGLLGADGRRGGVSGMLRRLGAVQLDTISVLARSHELVPYARLGAVGRDRVEHAFWPATRPTAFEYWSHAACVLPLADWPFYAARRRGIRATGQRWHKVSQEACDIVLARLRDEGPLTATQLGGAKAGGPWWDWSETKIAAEWLLDTGTAVCVRRTGWRRVYDLPERVIPAPLLDAGPDDAECLAYLAGVTARALGVATSADLVDYQRLNSLGLHAGKPDLLAAAADAAGLVPVTIAPALPASRASSVSAASSAGPARAGKAARPLAAWADPAALAWLQAGGRGTHRTTLLSPFDPLVWDRKRTLRMFGFEHSLEAYVPRDKRVHGYFAMPLLAGGRLVGRVDPGREGKTLVARHAVLESPAAVAPLARAMAEAATWVGCEQVAAERVTPAHLAGPVHAALAAVSG